MGPFAMKLNHFFLPPRLANLRLDSDSGGSGGSGNTDEEPVASLLSSLDGIRDQCNAMLAGLPPLEQYEAAQELSYGLRSLQSYGRQLASQAENLKSSIKATLAKMKERYDSSAQASARAALLATGEYVKKADHEAAINAALDSKAKELRTAFEAETVLKETISQRRAEIRAGLSDLPAEAAEKIVNAISAEILGADNYKESVEAIKGRIGKVREIGLDPAKAADFTAEVVALPLGEEGDKTAAARCEQVKQLIGAATTKAASATASSSASATACRQIPVGGGAACGAPLRVF
jgi:hypothetical protein